MNSVAKPFITVVTPCFNEEAILEINIKTLGEYLEKNAAKYDWEILIINDGSKDKTGTIADDLAGRYTGIRVIHHPTNLNLGNAIKTGFNNAKGDIIVIMDIDLSYAESHIAVMVDKLIETNADIVMASPYMKGGKVTAVPFFRKIMSSWVNKFMRLAAQDKYHTFTGMVRAYRKDFIKPLNLKTRDYEINPEIVYKGMILRAKIVEIPAHLDWTEQNKFKGKRSSSLRVLRGFFSGLMTGFIFRPYIFFLGIGSTLLILSLYELIWLLVDTLAGVNAISKEMPLVAYPFSYSLSQQFKMNPQTFIIGGITFVAAIQFLGLGFLSLQSKRYFEELFHLGSNIKKQNENQSNSKN
jgi:glycosyltransferase involved in cell wall biosynthesis